MAPRTANTRIGLTLLELLVVLAVLGLLLAVLLPAVQAVRESARKSTCQNNLRQIAVAIQSHSSRRGTLPRLYNGTFLKQPRNVVDEFHFHSWRTSLLTEVEQKNVWEAIDFSVAATDPANQPPANVEIPVFVCPSTSIVNSTVPDIYGWNKEDPLKSTSVVGTAARSDYEAVGGIQVAPQTGPSNDLSIIEFGAWGEPTYRLDAGVSIKYRTARLADITDGLSNTIVVGEKAGRPDWYRRGMPVDPYPYSDPQTGMDHHQAAWAISTHFWWTVLFYGSTVNETNATGLYAFHPGGANVALADGSVQFLSETTDVAVLKALATRAGGEDVARE